MPLTLDEILGHEERLRREIAERERLLTAYQILRTDTALVQNQRPAESALPIAEPASSSAHISSASTSAAPVDLPGRAPIPRYVNPALAGLRGRLGDGGKAVWWAIQQMTEDYTLRDIAALLAGEGWPMQAPEISVVLTRLKSRAQIEVVRCGGGRTPTVFRKPPCATIQEVNPTNLAGSTAATTKPLAES